MLSGILLILVTMLAVLGAYYLTELASQAGAKRKTLKNAVVLLCAQDARADVGRRAGCARQLPDAALVVLSPKAAEAQPLEPSMRGVTFASPGTVGAEVCRLLRCRRENNALYLKGISKWTRKNILPA